jgi:hypothetical protein
VPQAQIDFYTNGRDDRWVLPNFYYRKRFSTTVDSEVVTMDIVFIDTAILAPELYNFVGGTLD